ADDVGGSGAGSEMLWLGASNGTNSSEWSARSLHDALPICGGGGQPPVVTPTAATQTVAANASVGVTSLLSATDPDGNGTITQYEFVDSGAGGRHFTVGRVAPAGGDGSNFVVSAAQLGQTAY